MKLFMANRFKKQLYQVTEQWQTLGKKALYSNKTISDLRAKIN